MKWKWSNKQVWKISSRKINRVQGKMSEDEGKKIELSKRVYSFIRDFRVHTVYYEIFRGYDILISI